MKKLLCVLICVFMIFSASVTVFADDVHEGAENVREMGDVDFEGGVTAGDARAILRHSVGLDVLTGVSVLYGDVDFNGAVTAADARLALRASVNLETLQKHNIDPEQMEFSTCTKKGYIQGSCKCCHEKYTVELPLDQHRIEFKYCVSENTCTVCGETVSVTPVHGGGVNGKCSNCGYFDKEVGYEVLYNFVHANGVYVAPDYCVWEAYPEADFGLLYDEELEQLYICCMFYVVDEAGEIIAECIYYLDFSSDLNTYYIEALMITEEVSLIAKYLIDKEAISAEATGALTLTEFDAEDVEFTVYEKEQLELSTEAMATSMLLWFDDFAARNDFVFTVNDLGFSKF